MAPSLKEKLQSVTPLGTWVEWARFIFADLDRLGASIKELETKLQACSADITSKLNAARLETADNLTGAMNTLRPELKACQADIDALAVRVQEIETALATLRVKAGIWGAVAGAIPILITLVIALVVYLITKQLP